MAIVATFCLSGLLHDYCWSLIFYHHEHEYDDNGHCVDCFLPIVWKQTAFFVYNGIIMLLERPVTRHVSIIPKMSKTLPLPVLSTLVTLTALPVVHWFAGDWIIGGYFKDFPIGLFKIVRV